MRLELKEKNNLTSLDRIIQKRFHGAINIKGIRYQLLYSIYKSLEEYKLNHEFRIQLEGIEDFDLKVLNSKNQFIQVKTSKQKWNWAKYKNVFKSFYEVYQINNEFTFVLVSNFKHNNDWLKITGDSTLIKKEKKRLENKLGKISKDIGGACYDFFKNIHLITLNEYELFNSIKNDISDLYNAASSKIAAIFIDSLFSRFLYIAEKREIVSKHLLDDIWKDLNENISRQQEFSAFGDGLISKLEWREDHKHDDFFDGKRVRPGHIASQIDIPRYRWLERIDNGIAGTNICIIRASSGQGKSTLLYRYAHDYWDEKYIYILKSARTAKEIELLKDFLKYLNELDFPILLLIDNADFQTALWPEVAGYCSEIGIKVLVTIRHEDWFRFSNPNITNYEIIQPELGFNEAKEIYEVFLKQNRIHQDVISYQWAYEKIGMPHLLMEYVYLLTHGEMLKDRLIRQIKQFTSLREDKIKVEILRLISAADSLGSPINIKNLITNIPFDTDPQNIIDSLGNEYIEIKDGIMQGLHWVRSKHLTDLLHGQIYRLTDTAIKLLELIPLRNLSQFISNCIVNENIDKTAIFEKLKSKMKKYSLKEIEQVFTGLFLGGERQFFHNNKSYFDEAFELLGHSGVSLLGMSTTPTDMIDAIESLKNIKTNYNIEKLESIKLKIGDKNRGKNLCRDFSKLLNTKVFEKKFTKNELLKAPSIFYWLNIAKIKLDASFFVEQFTDIRELEELNEEVFYSLLSGLYEYDHNEYFNWYNQHREPFNKYLRYKTDSINLTINSNELSINYIPFNDELTANEQAMRRLNQLRKALPFCSKYSSHAITLLPFGLEPSVKDTEKNIPVKNMPLEFFTRLNRYWLDIIENAYLPDSFYTFEESHYELRQNIIKYVSILNTFFKQMLTGKKYNIEKALKKDNLIEDIGLLLDTVPDPPQQCEETIKQQFKELFGDSQTHFRNFFYQFFDYFKQERKNDIGGLALHNLKDYRKNLSNLYSGFSLLVGITPDYFGLKDLKSKEVELADRLIDLFEFYINNWERIPVYDYEKQIIKEKESFHSKILQNVRTALNGENVIISNRVFIDFPLSYLPLYFSVDNPVFPEFHLERLLPLFKGVRNTPSFYYLIPLFNDSRVIDGGYRIISNFDEKEFFWESLVPQEIPEEIMALLPMKAKSVNIGLAFKNDLLGCIGGIDVWIKQVELISTDEDDYYSIRLCNKLIELYIKTYEQLKMHFSNFSIKYSNDKEKLQLIFSGLSIEEIISFVENFRQIDGHEKAMVFLNQNINLWEAVLKYFGFMGDLEKP
jgi:hypothetical protein